MGEGGGGGGGAGWDWGMIGIPQCQIMPTQILQIYMSLNCSEKVPKLWHYMMVQTMLHTSMTVVIYVQ